MNEQIKISHKDCLDHNLKTNFENSVTKKNDPFYFQINFESISDGFCHIQVKSDHNFLKY